MRPAPKAARTCPDRSWERCMPVASATLPARLSDADARRTAGPGDLRRGSRHSLPASASKGLDIPPQTHKLPVLGTLHARVPSPLEARTQTLALGGCIHEAQAPRRSAD